MQTISDFKEGKYNILVSTSIGEEGLDIGEVDFVVIYDMPKQSIKLVSACSRVRPKSNGNLAATNRAHRTKARREGSCTHVRRPRGRKLGHSSTDAPRNPGRDLTLTQSRAIRGCRAAPTLRQSPGMHRAGDAGRPLGPGRPEAEATSTCCER